MALRVTSKRVCCVRDSEGLGCSVLPRGQCSTWRPLKRSPAPPAVLRVPAAGMFPYGCNQYLCCSSHDSGLSRRRCHNPSLTPWPSRAGIGAKSPKTQRKLTQSSPAQGHRLAQRWRKQSCLCARQDLALGRMNLWSKEFPRVLPGKHQGRCRAPHSALGSGWRRKLLHPTAFPFAVRPLHWLNASAMLKLQYLVYAVIAKQTGNKSGATKAEEWIHLNLSPLQTEAGTWKNVISPLASDIWGWLSPKNISYQTQKLLKDSERWPMYSPKQKGHFHTEGKV